MDFSVWISRGFLRYIKCNLLGNLFLVNEVIRVDDGVIRAGDWIKMFIQRNNQKLQKLTKDGEYVVNLNKHISKGTDWW